MDRRKQTNLPRGVRNNNPGNLKLSNIQWRGKIPLSLNTDRTFEQFEDSTYGIRALALDLKNDYYKDGRTTVEKLIGEFAPSSENNTNAYVQSVCNALNVQPNETLDFSRHIHGLIKAIIRQENGYNPITDDEISAGISLAGITFFFNLTQNTVMQFFKKWTNIVGIILVLISTVFIFLTEWITKDKKKASYTKYAGIALTPIGIGFFFAEQVKQYWQKMRAQSQTRK